MDKIEINLDSTSLGTSSCIKEFVQTVIGNPSEPDKGAYRQKAIPASMHFGVACHSFIDTMYKTRGRYDLAQKSSIALFNSIPFYEDKKSAHLNDPQHMVNTCYWLWTTYIENDPSFEVLSLPGKCWWCKDDYDEKTGITCDVICPHCDNTRIDKTQAATEVTFSLPFYEDDTIIVNLCGTQDRIGKFKNGIFCIKDWKFTSTWDKESYLESYDLSRQLRTYTLACKMMAELYPDSVMGQVGKTSMGAAIDAVFVKAKVSEIECKSTALYQYNNQDIAEYKQQLRDFCLRLSSHIRQNYYPKEGILNGTCSKLYGKHCQFWYACKSGGQVEQVLLNRDFKRVKWDPLHFND